MSRRSDRAGGGKISYLWQTFNRGLKTISKSKMISGRQGGGNEAYCIYVEEASDVANKDSALI
jgi:hypothetical protein